MTFRNAACLLTTASLMLAPALLGCNTKQGATDEKETTKKKEADPSGHGHAHPTAGPHGGHLIELGSEEYHGELLHSEKTHAVTIYILDGSAKKEVPVAQDAVTLNVVVNSKPTQFVMKAVDATDAMASQFVVEDVDLVHAFEDDKITKGKLNVTIGDKPYVGAIEHHAHGDGDDDHDDHDHDDHDHKDDHDKEHEHDDDHDHDEDHDHKHDGADKE